MKKNYLLLTGLLLLSSCNNSTSDVKVPLYQYSYLECEYSEKTDYMLCHITPDEFSLMNQRKEPFILFVWANGCGTCDEFSLSLKEYVHQTSGLIRYMRLYSYIQTDSHLTLSDSAMLFYSGGKLVHAEDDLSSIGSTKDLKKMMEQYVYQTETQVLNSRQIEYPLVPEYNTFTLLDSVGIKEDTEGFQMGFEKVTLTENKKNALLYNSDILTDFSLMEEIVKTENISYIADIKGDMGNLDSSLLNYLSLTEEEKQSSYFIREI